MQRRAMARRSVSKRSKSRPARKSSPRRSKSRPRRSKRSKSRRGSRRYRGKGDEDREKRASRESDGSLDVNFSEPGPNDNQSQRAGGTNPHASQFLERGTPLTADEARIDNLASDLYDLSVSKGHNKAKPPAVEPQPPAVESQPPAIVNAIRKLWSDAKKNMTKPKPQFKPKRSRSKSNLSKSNAP